MTEVLRFIHDYNDVINLILGVAGIITLIFSVIGLNGASRLLSKIIISEKTNEFVLSNIEQWFISTVYTYLERQKDNHFVVKSRISSSEDYVTSNNYSLSLAIVSSDEEVPEGRGNRITPYTTIGIRIYKKEKWIHITVDDENVRKDKFHNGLLEIRKEIDDESKLRIVPWNQQTEDFRNEKYSGILLDYSEVPFFYQNEIMKITKKIIDKYFRIKK